MASSELVLPCTQGSKAGQARYRHETQMLLQAAEAFGEVCSQERIAGFLDADSGGQAWPPVQASCLDVLKQSVTIGVIRFGGCSESGVR
jgi:hypothetical protein